MAEAKECPLEKLRELYVVQGLTAFSIAKYHLFVHNNTVAKWILIHRLDDERKKFLEEATERLKQQKTNIQDAEFEVIDDAIKNLVEPEQSEGIIQASLIPLQPSLRSGIPTPSLTLMDEDEEPSAFDLLTMAQKDFVILYLKEKRKPRKERMTLAQMAEKLDRNPTTIDEYLANPKIQSAIEEVTDPDFHFRANQAKQDQILEELEGSTRARHEIIKHTSDLLGQTSNDFNINFNVTSKSPNLKNRFK